MIWHHKHYEVDHDSKEDILNIYSVAQSKTYWSDWTRLYHS